MNKAHIWPVGLTVFLTLLIVGSLIFVLFTRQVHLDLVTDDYYQQGLAYQEQIDRMNRANRLTGQVEYSQVHDGELTLIFPQDFPAKEISGTIVFYRPDDRSKDFTLEIALDDQYRQIVDTAPLKKGNWKIHILWIHNSNEYLQKIPVYIK